tara:strand:- start:85 stop:522 length:438 start_codon:yes stop_codon:yes gene_type:complete
MRWILTSLVTLVIGISVLVACEGNVFALKAGDCYNALVASTEYTTEVSDVEVVKCDEPHTNEVYAVFDLPDSSWKGAEYFFEQADIVCRPKFEAFVGIEYDLSTLYSDVIYPSEESWNNGDRTVQCSVYEESYMKVTGSAKGSKR